MVRATPPRKYLDAKRTKVNPDWVAWEKAREDELMEEAWPQLASAGFDPTMYFPEEDDKGIPEEGAWILVIEEPHTPIKEKFRIPHLSMWRARSHTLNSGAAKIGRGITVYPKQAVITTPAGDLHLWPHEYIVAKNPMGLASDPDAELHSLGGLPVLDEAQLFYLMSRGISQQDATMMLFDTIESLDFVYVTFPEEITSILGSAARPLRRHIALNPR